MNTVHIIGLGGIGGILLQSIDKSKNLFINKDIFLWDKDRVEENNLDRQYFTKRDIGRNKAKSFYDRYKDSLDISFTPDFFTERMASSIHDGDIIFVCADNHGARLSALNVCDMKENVTVIIGANESIDAEAYIYFKEWKDTPFDPRVYYPTLLDHDPHDPTKPSCTGHVLEYTPQLSIANTMASCFMMFLFYTWLVKLPSIELNDSDRKDVVLNTPKRLNINAFSKAMYESFRKEYIFA